jgi:addiction module HigA family antidote
VILLEEFLKPMGISQVAFARHVGVPLQRINEIVRGKRGVTPDTAWRFAQVFGTSPEFWMNLQSNNDLVRFRPTQIVEKIHSIGAYRQSKSAIFKSLGLIKINGSRLELI